VCELSEEFGDRRDEIQAGRAGVFRGDTLPAAGWRAGCSVAGAATAGWGRVAVFDGRTAAILAGPCGGW